jgi:hypothetical protein
VSESKFAALDYLSRGWSVFPLRERSKAPSVQWSRYQLERATNEEVATWDESGGVAIVTGRLSGLVVVDFDPAKGGDSATWLARHPTNMLVETGGGGVHAFYQYPYGEEVRNATSFSPGVDIRAEGGYVVAPPSIHPNGQRYQWILQGVPAPLPDEVKHRVKAATTNQPGWVGQLLEEGAGEGKRDDSTAKLAGHYCRKGLSKDETKALLSFWNNQKNKPPLHASDVDKTVESVFRTAERTAAHPPATASSGSGKAGFQFDDFGEYMARYGDLTIPWVIKDWLPAKTIALVVSPPATRKTWVTLDLAISVATGTKFLNRFDVAPEQAGPVFLLQQEDWHGQTVQRLNVILHERYRSLMGGQMKSDGDTISVGLPPAPPIKIHTERKLRFEDRDAMRAFAESVAEFKPKLVILDPLYSATSADDFMARAANDMMLFKDLRDRYGTSFLICHHTKKGADKDGKKGGEDRERLWGSQFLNAFLETGWQFLKIDDMTTKIKRHFKSGPPPEDIIIDWDICTEPGDLRYVPQVTIASKKDTFEAIFEDDSKTGDPSKPIDPNKVYNKVVTYLQAHPGQRFDRVELGKAMNLDPSGINRYLQEPVRDGVIKKDGKHYVFEP